MEPFIVKISTKGQLTLPAEVRRKLGLIKGKKVYLVLDDDEIRIRAIDEQLPVFSKKSTLFKMAGAFSGPEDLSENHDQYVAEAFEE